MAYTTILYEQKSTYGSPYCFYTVQYYEKSRSASAVTLGIQVSAHLQYAASYQGYKLIGTLTVGGTAFTIPLKGTEMWSGTATHVVTQDITVSASASTTALSAYFSVSNPSTTGSVLSTVACSNIAVSRYYTAASVSAAGGKIGNPISIALSGKYPSSNTCDLTYSFCGKQGTIAKDTSATSISWDTGAIKDMLLEAIPEASKGLCTITCNTKYSGSSIGTATCTIELTTDEKPSVNAAATTVSPINDNAFLKAKNIFAAGYSKARVVISASPGQGAAIKGYSITGLDETGTSSDWTSGVIKKAGSKTVKISVSDSRSTSPLIEKKFQVESYAKPTLVITTERGTVTGGEWKASDSGVNLRISGTVTTALVGNTASVYLSLDDVECGALADLSNGAFFEKVLENPIPTDTIHKVKAYAIDALEERGPEAVVEIPTAIVNMSMLPDNKGITFGGHPVEEGLVSRFPTKLYGGVSLDVSKCGFTSSFAGQYASVGGVCTLAQLLLDFAHPVGSYYWSSSETNPGTLFGGNWTQITDRFVLAAGSSYSVNGTGGAATVALGVAQMPSHAHSVSGTAASAGSHDHAIRYKAVASGSGSWITLRRWDSEDSYTGTNRATSSDGAHTHSVSGTAAAAGGGSAHENMPPYIVAYCWRRTS